MAGALGRREPQDWVHVDRYKYSAIAEPTVSIVNRTLRLPKWHWTHDQGKEGSCVGHGSAMERAISNTAQNVLLHALKPSVRYDPIDIWNEAKKTDDFPDTNPGDDSGTTVRAAYDVLRNEGPLRVKGMEVQSGVPIPVGEDPTRYFGDGVATTRWATTVDEMRTAINSGLPVTIGVNWYTNFDAPVWFGKSTWIGRTDLGSVRGGHCVCIFGASDRLQAFKVKNSWGKSYPIVWLPYAVMGRLLSEDGEAALITDK